MRGSKTSDELRCGGDAQASSSASGPGKPTPTDSGSPMTPPPKGYPGVSGVTGARRTARPPRQHALPVPPREEHTTPSGFSSPPFTVVSGCSGGLLAARLNPTWFDRACSIARVCLWHASSWIMPHGPRQLAVSATIVSAPPDSEVSDRLEGESQCQQPSPF